MTASELTEAVESGKLKDLSRTQLFEALQLVYSRNGPGCFSTPQLTQVGESIRAFLLERYIDSLQAHITDLNRQNKRTERWVIALAVASLIGTTSQTWYAYKADRKSEAQAHPATVSVPSKLSAQ